MTTKYIKHLEQALQIGRGIDGAAVGIGHALERFGEVVDLPLVVRLRLGVHHGHASDITPEREGVVENL